MALTLLILLIDASLKSRSPAPRQQLAAGTWVDRVLPVISRSTEEGQAVAGIWANGLKTPAPALASTINSVASEAAQNYQTVVKLRPPDSLLGPAGLLEAALLARSEAAANLQKALVATLGSAAAAGPSSPPSGASPPAPTTSTTAAGGRAGSTTTTPTTAPPVGAPPASQVPVIAKAGSDIQVGDSAYSLFVGSIPPSLGIHMPASTWATDLNPYTPQAAQVFLSSLQSAVVTSPVHQVKVLAVSLKPSPVSTNGAVQVLPDSSAVTVTIVVADTGNQPESNLTVTAAISPAGRGTSSVRDFVNLQPGQAYTISGLGPLNPPQGPTVTLTVSVTPAAGSSTPPVTSTVNFSMPAPPPPTTTTTSTTVPPKPGG
ncbi:MAG TPA: hypothetical protein VFN68_16595 [Acidimicrobiales bacterium]|nr:hypothetical protein [Acidimicrobiales bacterium]